MKTTAAMPEEPDDDKEKKNPLEDAPWFVPVTKVKLADGTYLLKTGKPFQRAQAGVCAKVFNISTKTLMLLGEAGHIRRARVSPMIFLYYPGEIEEFIRRMEEDPDYWTPQRRREYGLIRDGKKKDPS